jgi:hypothetical protein
MSEQAPKHRRGCLFYGCIMGALLLTVMLVAGLIGLRYARKMFNDFTDARKSDFPKVALSQAEIDGVERRIDAFREAVRQEQPTAPLALTADEINALIATDPDLRAFKGKIYVIMDGDQLKGKVSVSMDEVGLPIFKNRFLNGLGTFQLSFKNGILRLIPEAFVVKGKPVPNVYMDKIRTQNLARDINSDARAKVALDRLEDIRVKDSKLVITPKVKK